ncbi:hypothetical protein MMC28_007326 [Mycoblastus sanguinarius]|nr:hypothetical protein [Mycoblastus sanguinarius]
MFPFTEDYKGEILQALLSAPAKKAENLLLSSGIEGGQVLLDDFIIKQPSSGPTVAVKKRTCGRHAEEGFASTLERKRSESGPEIPMQPPEKRKGSVGKVTAGFSVSTLLLGNGAEGHESRVEDSSLSTKQERSRSISERSMLPEQENDYDSSPLRQPDDSSSCPDSEDSEGEESDSCYHFDASYYLASLAL